ncbi:MULTISPECIES: MFS transporter [unclassified Caballeronia]|uniref:MFS transporter n=1 Tax=unclassified Caballeronia TaxID=2646786 RepID=UPI0028626F96|nr:MULTISPECIES: MFS transporter [unclassified Caballeronia]MDR5752479.1 MFS transporter [Caballeronia sp. LZ024]MDR5845285.1 MFS transporter [Caballeronia sp. LZ031]
MLTAGSWPCIILLYIFGTVATSLVTQSVPIIGDIASYFHLSHAASGWVISIPSLITALFALFAGWLVDRIGDKRVILGGSIFAFVGNMGVFFAHDIASLFASRLLEGVGYLSLTVGAVTLIMRTTTGARRSIALGLWTSHTAVGIGLTLSVVAPLAQHGDAWRWAFGGHAILMAALTAAAFLLPRKIGQTHDRRIGDIWLVLRSRAPYRVALASGASAFIQTGVMAALTVYLARRFQISIALAAGIGTLAEVFVAVGCLSVGHLLKSGAKTRVLALAGGAVMLAGGVVLYLPATALVGASAAVCAFSLGIGVVNATIWTLVPSAAPTPATLGATSGLVSQATYLGVLLGPPAVFATFYEGGWKVRIALMVGATVLQLAPIVMRTRSDHASVNDVQPLGHH